MKQILKLPIDSYIQEILTAVENYSTVLVKASPGSGKTTRLPWEMVKKFNQKVAVLEPRRLAAKLAAQRIADEQNLILGQEVGYHFRFDKNITDETKLTFYTEGTFLKKFLSDSQLNDFDIVILDEFHERHLETDLALALLKNLQKIRKIKIVIMSATLDLKLINVFPESTSIEIEATHFPVQINYLDNVPSILNQSLELKINQALAKSPDGDVLIFLPGMREMLKVKDTIKAEADIFLLHADLSKEEQALALEKNPNRKIILATNIAESSVTIPGITVVIDSGIQRSAHYSPWNGLKTIQDSPVTKSSAIQRAGRAGRTGPGICYRLYSKQDFDERRDHTVPEIETADLTDVCLLVSAIELSPDWMEAPPQEKWKKAEVFLTSIGALENNKLTALGKKMMSYPVDARLARIFCDGENLDRKNKEKLLDYICTTIEEDFSGTMKRRLQFFLKYDGIEKHCEKCVLQGFRDQLAFFRIKQRDFIHYSGKSIKPHSSLNQLSEGYYLILDITQRVEAIKVLSVEEEWLWELQPFPFTEEESIDLSDNIIIKKKTKLGSIVVDEITIKNNWSELNNGLKYLITTQAKTKFQKFLEKWKESSDFERYYFWAKEKQLNFEAILEKISLEKYFGEYDLNWDSIEKFIEETIKENFDILDLDKNLPRKINLGGKRELSIHYPINMEPYIEAPIQDFYGLLDTPKIMQGKTSVTLKLLGPHKRPMQVTKDLQSFWHKTYQEMKKEYQRDYPRHYWPDKPWEEKPFLLKSHLPKA